MMKVEIKEDESITLARFLSGLSLEIRDKVELLPYRNFHDLVQIYIKVKQQILRRGPSRSSYSNSYPKQDSEREGKLIREKPIENPSKVIDQENLKRKEEHATCNHTSDIKYFKCLGRGHVKSQCPSMRTILMNAQDVYNSEEEKHEESTGEESECEGREDVYAHGGKLLMIRRTLTNQSILQTEL